MQSLSYVYRNFISEVYLEWTQWEHLPAIGTTPAFRNASLCNETTIRHHGDIDSFRLRRMRAAFHKFIRIYLLSFKQTRRRGSFILVCIRVLLCLHDRLFPCIISLISVSFFLSLSLSFFLVLPFTILHSITSHHSFRHLILPLSIFLPRSCVSYIGSLIIGRSQNRTI